jgi:DNA-directed RNA polymerase alpha subunit
MSHLSRYEIRAGPIAGLRLPFATWAVLMREGITTLDHLRAVADHLEQFEGIGRKSAQIIREELARVAPPNQGQ